MLSDHQFFVGRNYPGSCSAVFSGNPSTAGRVGGGIELYADPGGSLADAFPDLRRVLPNTGREHQGVEPPQRSGQRTQFAADAVGKQFHREFGVLLMGREQRAHVAGDAGYSEQTRLLVEQLFDR